MSPSCGNCMLYDKQGNFFRWYTTQHDPPPRAIFLPLPKFNDRGKIPLRYTGGKREFKYIGYRFGEARLKIFIYAEK